LQSHSFKFSLFRKLEAKHDFKNLSTQLRADIALLVFSLQNTVAKLLLQEKMVIGESNGDADGQSESEPEEEERTGVKPRKFEHIQASHCLQIVQLSRSIEDKGSLPFCHDVLIKNPKGDDLFISRICDGVTTFPKHLLQDGFKWTRGCAKKTIQVVIK
jgi:hypothetical protein